MARHKDVEHMPLKEKKSLRDRCSQKDACDQKDDNSDSSEGPPPKPNLVNGRFEITKKIGSGSYSDVHLGHDLEAAENVAVKFEWTKAEKGRRLLYEAQLYESLAGTEDVPRVRWSGTQGDYNIMVMELLGPSLEDLFKAHGKKFSVKTVLMLAEQMIDRIEYVHSKGILHRDIKPHNFLMGVGERSAQVYIMDFGLARRYIDIETGEHIPCRTKSGLTGTVRYTSLNVHKGLEPSRRDDLSSIGYVLMEFNRGKLPWQGIAAKSKRAKQKKIGRCKEDTSFETLCEDFPAEFVQFFVACESLGFDERPNYDHLRGLLRDIFARESFERNFQYDWMLAPNKDVANRPNGALEDGRRSQKSKRLKVVEKQKSIGEDGVKKWVQDLKRNRGHNTLCETVGEFQDTAIGSAGSVSDDEVITQVRQETPQDCSGAASPQAVEVDVNSVANLNISHVATNGASEMAVVDEMVLEAKIDLDQGVPSTSIPGSDVPMGREVMLGKKGKIQANGWKIRLLFTGGTATILVTVFVLLLIVGRLKF